MNPKENKWCVYKHTNKVNDKVYIGITCQNPKARWLSDGSGYKNQPKFYNAIKKYGRDSFNHQILEKHLNLKEANLKEQECIQKFNSVKNGYNTTEGGDGCWGIVWTEERRQLMSNKFKGRPLTEEQKIKISKTLRGRKTKPCSEETKRKISEAQKGKNISEDTRVKMSERAKERCGELNSFYGKNHTDFTKNKIAETRKLKIGSLATNKSECHIGKMKFSTIKQCADFLGMEQSIVASWLRKECLPPQKLVDIGFGLMGEEDLQAGTSWKSKRTKVFCDGIVFKNCVECSSFYGIKNSTMKGWLLGDIRTPKDFVEKELHYLPNKFDKMFEILKEFDEK